MEETKVKEEKKDICRVCLTFNYEDSDERVSLFDKHNDSFIFEKINYIASIEIKRNDSKPDRICSSCLQALDNACKFKQKCENSDAILKSSFETDESQQKDYLEIPIKKEVDRSDEYDIPRHSPFHVDIENDSSQVQFESECTDINKYECHDCGYVFKSKCKLGVHWRKMHLLKQLVCPNCKKTHKTYKSFHNHLKRKSKGCMNATKVRVEGEGKTRMFHCKDCDAKSKRLQTILTHTLIHTGERPYTCDICGKSFSQQGSLIGHRESIHGVDVKELTCHHCGKHLAGRNKWYKHMKRHANVKTPCPICKKVFASQTGLKVHMKRHSDKTITCEFCAKTFSVTSDLRNHKVKAHFKNRIYSCNVCEYKSHDHGTMSKHKKRHNGTNIACLTCGRFVENEQQLILHKKRHLEKNFKCSLCEKAYYGRKNLGAHVRRVHNLYGQASAAVKVEIQ